MKRETMDMGGRRAATTRARGTRPARSKSKSTRNRSRARAGRTASARGRGSTRTASQRSRAGATRGAAQGRAGQRGGSARSTTDLNEIRQWAEARGGKPVSVKGTARGRNPAGLLRIDFPGYSGAGRFEEVSWDEWYRKFQESNLEFLYQDRAASGQQSRFFKLVCRGTSARKNSRGNSRAGSRRGTQTRSRSRSNARARRR